MNFYEEFDDEFSIFLVCEYCNNKTLLNYIINNPINKEINLKIIFEIGIGVYILHRNGITHRDLKPNNILIHNGQYKICDFGLSSDTTKMETNLGTNHFKAPEISQNTNCIYNKRKFKKSKYNNKVDVYSLGVIFYLMMTKEYPFEIDSSFMISTDNSSNFQDLEERFDNIEDPEIKALIQKCLEMDPEERISMEEFLKDDVFRKIWTDYSKIFDDYDIKMSVYGRIN